MNSFLKPFMKSLIAPVIPGGIITMLIFYLDYFQFALVEKFLLFAAFVIAPLVISLLSHDERNKQQRMLFTAIKRFQFPAALLALASVASNKTWGLGDTCIPGVLSLGWLLFTLLLCIYGVTIIVIHKGKIAEIAIGAGLVYFLSGVHGSPYISIKLTSSKLILRCMH
jgi:hypothetical protein